MGLIRPDLQENSLHLPFSVSALLRRDRQKNSLGEARSVPSFPALQFHGSYSPFHASNNLKLTTHAATFQNCFLFTLFFCVEL